MAVARALTTENVAAGVTEKDQGVAGAARGAVFKAVADALEVIPRTLVQNAGGNAIRVLTELRVRPGFSSLICVLMIPRVTGKTRCRRALVGY
jgi:chaperonin GroEL (HSP60 family)